MSLSSFSLSDSVSRPSLSLLFSFPLSFASAGTLSSSVSVVGEFPPVASSSMSILTALALSSLGVFLYTSHALALYSELPQLRHVKGYLL